MTIPARLSFVTLAVRDMARMRRFYRQLGWPESKFSDDSFIAFQCGGAVLGLFGIENYKTLGEPRPAGTFGGVVLSINCHDAAEVDRLHEDFRHLDGITLRTAPRDLSFGGRAFEWADPEGNEWEVVWADGTSFDGRDGLIFP